MRVLEKYCQAQGQTRNVTSKLDPKIGFVMGSSTIFLKTKNQIQKMVLFGSKFVSCIGFYLKKTKENLFSAEAAEEE